jgi:hypothetical protein
MASCGSTPGTWNTDLSHNRLDFTTEIHTPKTASFLLYHTWSSAVSIAELKLTGNAVNQFQIASIIDYPIKLQGSKNNGLTVTIHFIAAQVGDYQAFLEVYVAQDAQDAPQKAIQIELIGRATQPSKLPTLQTDVENNVLDFGTISTQGLSTKQLMLFTESTKALYVDKLQIVDNDKNVFKIVFPPPVPFLVHSGKENGRPLVIQANSEATGDFKSWLLLASSDAENISKEGTKLIEFRVRIEPYKKPGELKTDLASNRLVFRDVPANQKAEQSFLLYNTGELPLEIRSFEIMNDTHKVFEIVDPPQTPFKLEPGKSETGKTIKIKYLYSKESIALQANLQIKYVFPEYPKMEQVFHVTLAHEATRAWMTMNCNGEMIFGNVRKNQNVSRICTLRSTGNIALEIRSYQFTKTSGEAGHFIWHIPTLPVSIEPNQSVSVQIWYHPKTAPSQDEGVYKLDTNIKVPDGMEPPNIRVIGNSVE